MDEMIELPFEDMKKYAIRNSLMMIVGGAALYVVIGWLWRTEGLRSAKAGVAGYVAGVIAVLGVFCWFYSLFNATRAAKTIEFGEESLKINDDVFGYNDLVEVAFDWGRLISHVNKFNSIYLTVKTDNIERKYWLGLDEDPNTLPYKKRISAAIDKLEKLYGINR